MLTITPSTWPPTDAILQTLTDRGYVVLDTLDATHQLIIDHMVKSLATVTPEEAARHAMAVENLDGIATANADFLVKAFVNDARRLTKSDQLTHNPTDPLMGLGIVVGIIDTGIDAHHPGFAGRILSEQDFTGEGNGDRHGHGTHCAGIVGMQVVNGYQGFAPGCSYRIYKVLGESGGGSATAIVRAINQAITDQCDVLSMSLGGSQPGDRDQLTDAVDAAVAAGLTVVVAAGNEGQDLPQFDNTPAKSLKAITVGATTKDPEGLASFSSYGETLGHYLKPDISAPGVDIVSARASGTSMGTPVDDLLTTASGTSMATPAVAGMVAQLIAGFLAGGTLLTPLQVKGRLMAYAEHVGIEPQGDQGEGRVNVLDAVLLEAPPLSEGDTRHTPDTPPQPPPPPPHQLSPCTQALAEALADPVVSQCLASAHKKARRLLAEGHDSKGLLLLADAAGQLAASVRDLVKG